MSGFIRGCGVSLVVGGLLLALLNVVLTPMLPNEQGEAVTRTSTVYLVRLSLAGVAALLLLFGCIGVHLAQRSASGVFGAVAFVVTFVGTCLVVAVEWSNVFVLRAVASTGPDLLPTLNDSGLMTIGFVVSASLFALGWLLLAISVLRAGMFSRWVSLAVLVGLVAIPAPGATPLGVYGAIMGNAMFGIGLAALGREVIQAD